MPSIRRWSPVLVAVICACGGGSDPSGPPPPPATGSLAVAITGLPSGTVAAVTVTGPAGYAHGVSASETISGLALGGYTVTGLLASGSMGLVYRGKHPSGHPVAIKAMHRQLHGNPEVTARFFAESIATARITHPNVIRFFDFGHGVLGYAPPLCCTADEIDAIIERTRRTLDQTLADPDVRAALA